MNNFVKDDIFFDHDCDDCVSLGNCCDRDMYFCNQGGSPTVIARESDTPWDYVSGMDFVGINPYLTIAYFLAKDKGLV